jgi:hypothetical protein
MISKKKQFLFWLFSYLMAASYMHVRRGVSLYPIIFAGIGTLALLLGKFYFQKSGSRTKGGVS